MTTSRSQLEAGLSIRTANPGDRGPIARLLYSSGPDFYDYLFHSGRVSALDFIQREFLSGRGFCGYANVTVAILDGRVVATGCFFNRAAYLPLTAGTAFNSFGSFGLTGALAVAWRSRHTSRLLKAPCPGELYLANFGVDASLRGQGVGSAMIHHRLVQAREQGYRSFGLDVAVTNPRAQALYERLGLRVVEEKHFSGPAGEVADQRKMEMRL